ncbi:hypothetical protein HMPREF9431_01055 [Segatella oulorum F0390]|uniref:Uncharacterized protein n=1 Tax=Segatella oulorum F0390 TaxID=702438 RepID=G1WB54_9BACT|nr:DUF6261 family protein [Segatella oulorum]EGV32349.1 hypothetical protein HMPREF9431_01055 [Segatella oulorum F0390]
MKNSKETTPRYVRVTGAIATHTSAMHGELHQQLYSLVAAQDKQKLHLTDELLKAWNDLIAQEVELNNAQQDTELTAKMQQLDDDRDALITQIFSAIRSNRRSPVKALREPAERLVKLVNSYKGIQTEVLMAESLHVNGLLMDLAKQPTDTAALGLTAVIAMLKTTNEEFEELELKRIDGTDKSGPTSTKAVRPLTDEKFYEVRGNVEAAFYYATTATDKQMIATLVDNLNAMLARYATSRKSSKAQQDIAKQMELESNHKRIDPLLPALAAKTGHAAGDLSFTGRTQSVKKETRYEVLAASTGKKQWARLVGGELVFVKTKPSAKGSGSATLKPKDKKPGDGGSPGKGGDGGKGGDAPGKGKDTGGDDASGKGKNPDGGQGDVTVTPKA